MEVIGTGFGRTGTLSLKLALEALGFGPCYHMIETREHPAHNAAWLALAEGRSEDWRSTLEGYRATVDWPAVFFWKTLVAENPDAKVILTLRDPSRWYESANRTIFPRMLEANMDRSEHERAEHMRMVNAIVLHGTFGGDLSRENAIATFEAHNADVQRSVPPDRLLIYTSHQGWAPLCEFLGADVPKAPYPRVNSTKDFSARFPLGS